MSDFQMDSQLHSTLKIFFTTQLLEWYHPEERPMPWKGLKNPYYIWLSEIILQQTRVEQGWPYYLKFVDHYPSIHDLARASEDEVMKLWEGLGYYSRARNMHFTAKYISKELNGKFPNTYESILKLKGVGPYTAAAIASFAFNLPNAVLDGNVYRVLSRFFSISTPIDTTEGKKTFSKLAQSLIKPSEAATYNQAIMDLGATICTPKSPKCGSCPLHKKCLALKDNLVEILPVKSKKIKKRTRYFHYLVIEQEEGILIQKREKKDIWQKLYEFILIESEEMINDPSKLYEHPIWQKYTQNFKINRITKPYQQQLTHQKIVAIFFEIHSKPTSHHYSPSISLIERKNLSTLAFPKLIDCYLKDKSLYLIL